MPSKINRLRARTQNLILGSVTGTVVGVNLKFFFQRLGATDLIWIFFFILGPAIGYFSGKERERIESLKNEKSTLKENLEKIQETLKKSTQKYKLLVEQANEAIFLTSAQGKILLFNQALALLTGYSKEQLKKMNISHLKSREETDVSNQKMWLDNGYSRSEEKWRKKDKTYVLMDISSKWIKVANHQLILHVARNIQNRSEAQKKIYIQEMGDMARLHVTEEAKRQKAILNKILNPINKTVLKLNDFKEKYSSDAPVFEQIGSMWENAGNTFSGMAGKIKRDLFKGSGKWEINNIIMEELHYLNFIFGDKDIVVKTSLAQGLPMVQCVGRDLSVVLGSILKAAIKSCADSDGSAVNVSTRLFDESITVEVMLSGTDDFYQNLNEIFDPLEMVGPSGSAEGGGMIICRHIGDEFGFQIDAGKKNDKSFAVRIRMPAARKLQTLSNTHEPAIGNTRPADEDSSLII
ncbi:PAS domain S-box protein [bacterium]|nr:PAS domain S-box protein [bacterium]